MSEIARVLISVCCTILLFGSLMGVAWLLMCEKSKRQAVWRKLQPSYAIRRKQLALLHQRFKGGFKPEIVGGSEARVIINFTHSCFYVNSDGSGKTVIPDLGFLPFDASTGCNTTLLGSPFLIDDPSIGYDNQPQYKHQANAEHEALHLWAMERLLNRASPNHCILIEDVHSQKNVLWRTREELCVVGIQYYVNTGIIHSCFTFVCREVFGVDCDNFIREAAEALREFRATFETVVTKPQGEETKCNIQRLC